MESSSVCLCLAKVLVLNPMASFLHANSSASSMISQDELEKLYWMPFRKTPKGLLVVEKYVSYAGTSPTPERPARYAVVETTPKQENTTISRSPER